MLASTQAEELEAVLAAVLEPERSPLVRSALATTPLVVDVMAQQALDEAGAQGEAVRARPPRCARSGASVAP